MKRALPIVLLSVATAFLISQWKGMSYNQRYVIAFLLVCIAGGKAFMWGGHWPLIWVIFVVLLVFIPIVYLIGTFFNLWGKK